MEPRDGLLSYVATLGVRDATYLVVTNFLRQRAIIDLRAEGRPAGEYPGSFSVLGSPGLDSRSVEQPSEVADRSARSYRDRGERRCFRRQAEQQAPVRILERDGATGRVRNGLYG